VPLFTVSRGRPPDLAKKSLIYRSRSVPEAHRQDEAVRCGGSGSCSNCRAKSAFSARVFANALAEPLAEKRLVGAASRREEKNY